MQAKGVQQLFGEDAQRQLQPQGKRHLRLCLSISRRLAELSCSVLVVHWVDCFESSITIPTISQSSTMGPRNVEQVVVVYSHLLRSYYWWLRMRKQRRERERRERREERYRRMKARHASKLKAISDNSRMKPSTIAQDAAKGSKRRKIE